MRYVCILAVMAVSLPAHGKELPLTEQEQSTVLALCDIAAQSPAISREMRANIAASCLVWQKKVEAANATPAPPAPPVPPAAPARVPHVPSMPSQEPENNSK